MAREESRARDELRQREDTEWDEVAAAESRVRERYREARQGRWRAMLKKGANAGEMWSLVRGARKGKGPGGRQGEMLRVGDRVLVTARAKANAFVSMYERDSCVCSEGAAYEGESEPHLEESRTGA